MNKSLYVFIITMLLCTCNTKNKIEKTLKLESEADIEKLINQLTIVEKASMVHANGPFSTNGIERLGIPGLICSDGPHGVRGEINKDNWFDSDEDLYATYFPTSIGLAATWNIDIAREFGESLGRESRARGKDIQLGPGVNINRTPLCGRNFEYLGEDPYLASQMVVPIIKGIQSNDVAACVKHYAINNQEYNRNTINVEVDERALREIYLPTFKSAVQEANVYSIMSAYNKFRGQYCSENEYLLNKILRKEWGFDGVIISDWNAVHSTEATAKAGLDIEMGSYSPWRGNREYGRDYCHTYSYFGKRYLTALQEGRSDTAELNNKVKRILKLMQRINLFDKRKKGELNSQRHKDIAKKTAKESIVLLKNEKKLLPLNIKKIKSLAIIGENAKKLHARGGGSSQVKCLYESTPYEGILNYVGDSIKINYAPGTYSIAHQSSDIMMKEAVFAAKSSDVVIYIGGLDHKLDQEGTDRKDLSMYGDGAQQKLIMELSKVNPNIIVVMIGSGPADMVGWIDNIPSVIQAWYPGQEGGNALAEIIFGRVNPSGKSPVTIPKKLEDSPAHAIGEYPGENGTVTYKEGLLVGYRYYDTKNVEPLFCFGHGLSYTQFEYKDIVIEKKKDSAKGLFKVKCKITNTGDHHGAEVVQMYIHDENSNLERPEKELKGFQKIFLKKGQTANIEFQINKESLSYFDDSQMKWIAEPGIFKVLIGSSSRDIRLSKEFVY